MKKLVFAGLGIILAIAPLGAQDFDTTIVKPQYHEVNFFVEDNEACFKCHGDFKFILEDEEYGRSATKRMAMCKIIDRENFYNGVHKSFSCTDCHSADFMEFPHSMDSRFEEPFMCMDCHGYDETYAHYNFESIETEFGESIHNIEGFSCWSCHNPHGYQAFVRNAEDLDEAILYDNNMCLKCHADFTQFSMLTEREEMVVVESHDWLPYQTAHFAHVRCIECHTEINDTILVAHKILPKEQAVKNCTECHSADSRLMHSLYKFESLEEKGSVGFLNRSILKDSYVIGANQNIWMNRASFIILGLAFAVIGLHTYLRFKKLKKS